jgi:hypothetical protein
MIVNKKIDKLFVILSVFSFLFVALMFHSWNDNSYVEIPKTQGKLDNWGVDFCDIKNNYVYISAWSYPAGVRKFENTMYIKSLNGKGYFRLHGQTYRRNLETKEMKSSDEFDNSGLVSSIRIPPWNEPVGREIVMISRAKDGELYRGDYVCK